MSYIEEVYEDQDSVVHEDFWHNPGLNPTARTFRTVVATSESSDGVALVEIAQDGNEEDTSDFVCITREKFLEIADKLRGVH